MAEIAKPVEAFLLGVLEAQIEALLRLQAPSGAWHTLLDDPTSYEEMSATAGIGYGLHEELRASASGPRRAVRRAGAHSTRCWPTSTERRARKCLLWHPHGP